MRRNTVPRALEGWRSLAGRTADGTIESDERVQAARPVVELSNFGARRLGDHYWREVTRASRGVVRSRKTRDGVELRLLGRGPSLLSFAAAQTTHDDEHVSCRYPILGGALAARPGGALTLSQIGRDEPELRAAVTGFAPRLRGPLHEHVQRRLHLAISRRYFRQLIDEAPA